MKVGGVDLTPQAAALLQAHLQATGLPMWRVLDDLVMIALGGQVPPDPAPPLPPLALEIAEDVAAFLTHSQDSATASKAIRRAWKQARTLASRDLAEGQAAPPRL